jgi:hypothetical protein
LQAPASASTAAWTWPGEEDQMDEIGRRRSLGRDARDEILPRQEDQQRRQAGVNATRHGSRGERVAARVALSDRGEDRGGPRNGVTQAIPQLLS